jgi:hypothetical protein
MFLAIGYLDRTPILQRIEIFGNLTCFRSHMKRWETFTLLGPLCRANLNHLTTYVSVSTAIYESEIKVRQREIVEK